MKSWLNRLQTRLTLYLLLMSLVPVLLVGAIAFQLGRASLQQETIRRLETAASLKENAIESWLLEKRQLIRVLAQSPELSKLAAPVLAQADPGAVSPAVYESLSRYLATAQAEVPDLLELSVLSNVGGKVMLSTDPDREGDFHTTDTFFTKGRDGTYVQNVYFSSPLGRTTMTVASPIAGEDGQPLGVLIAHLDLNRLDEITSERAGLGDTGETYLVDSLNVFISQARGGTEAFPRGVHTAGIDSALTGQNGSGFYRNYQDAPVIGVYRWLPERELALLAEIEEGEALAPVVRLGWIVTIITALILALFVGVAYLIGRQISQPVLAITKVARDVAAGDLSQRAPVTTRDEIGQLAQTFNDMTDQLSQSYTSLERRITALQVLTTIGERLSAILELEPLLAEVVQQVRDRFGFYHTHIYLLDQTGQRLTVAAGTGEAGAQMKAAGHNIPTSARTSLVARAARGKEAVLVDDVAQSPDWLPNPLLPDTRSEIAVPVILAEEVVGVLDVQADKTAAFAEGVVSLLQSLANQVAVAIRNARLFEEVEAALAEARDLQERYMAQTWQQADRRNAGRLHYLHHGEQARPLDEDQQRALRQIQRQARESGQAAMTDLPLGDEAARSLLAPVKLRDLAIGSVQINRMKGDAGWSEEDLRLLETLLQQFAQTADNLRLFEETQYQASQEREVREITDKLRDAPNLDALLETAVQELGRRLPLRHAVVEMGITEEPSAPGNGSDTNN